MAGRDLRPARLCGRSDAYPLRTLSDEQRREARAWDAHSDVKGT